MRAVDADELKKYKFTTQIANGVEIEDIEVVPVAAIDNAQTIEEKSYAMGFQDGVEDGLQGLRPQGEWIVTGEEQGAFGITYKIRKCNKCGWEHSLVIPDNFCPNCGAGMQKGGAE